MMQGFHVMLSLQTNLLLAGCHILGLLTAIVPTEKHFPCPPLLMDSVACPRVLLVGVFSDDSDFLPEPKTEMAPCVMC